MEQQTDKSKVQILHPNGSGVKAGPWYTKIQDEALTFATVVRKNFEFGLVNSVKHLPKQDRDHKAQQLDVFIDAIVGVTVQCVAEFATYSEQMENAVVEAIKKKFQYVRENIAEVKKEQEENAKKLVSPNGKPLS